MVGGGVGDGWPGETAQVVVGGGGRRMQGTAQGSRPHPRSARETIPGDTVVKSHAGKQRFPA